MESAMQVADNVAWVEANFGQVDLRDKRLNRRLQILASNALKRPQGSVVAQNVSSANFIAASFKHNPSETAGMLPRQISAIETLRPH